MKKLFHKNLLGKIITYLILIILFISVVYPFFWTLMSSFKTETEIDTNPLGLPKNPTIDAYKKVWTLGTFGEYFRNSVIVTFLSLLGILTLSTLAGYGFARYDFKSSKLIFFTFVITMAVTPPSIMIAEYKLIQTLHLMNTYIGVIFIYFSWTSLGIMLTRIAFLEIPQELIDAACIDGCNEFRIFWWICLPIIKPTLATVAIFQLIAVWNNFIWPLLILQSSKYQTVVVGLLTFQGGFLVEWSIITAGLSIAMMPVLILYLIFQRFFVRGLTLGALK